ncbi:similar to Saccharomyces cerevisiae YHL020C OPI1 Transcriptional regulator of a variety of genes [Maudiozyma saulgeensis]|uniref:Similar to Saccharomyces cerevisiae YHL020C OPI1 Transcriptional regulator of a variety of genes n=1 Tax=Maudiozyma saulgeensis TaxID=1789683 RepID=A0A1X7R8J7_9SACH|nr:similar to Saccharomyces cerevisiae YHL020C OPI1 Transcriptional regulator of a variety of genes [Kazachstania saulgeensis]
MGLREHPGMSEEDLKAAEVLGVLKKSQPKYNNALNDDISNSSKRRRSISDSTNESTMESNRVVKPRNNITGHSGTLLNRMVSNVVTFYDDFNDRKRVASIARLLDDAYEDNYTSSEDDSESSSDDEEEEEEEEEETKEDIHELQQEDVNEVNNGEEEENMEPPTLEDSDNTNLPRQDENEEESEEERISKRKIISEALQTTRDNLKEYKLNMSIESKKRLITCLHLLKLANKQLSDKVMNLQAMVKEEQTVPRRRRRTLTNSHDRHGVHRYKRQRASTISGGNTQTIKSSNNDEPQTNKTDGVPPTYDKKVSETSESSSGSETDAEEDYYGADEDEEFFDAFDSNDFDEKSTVIKMEVVGTIKKVYSLISSYTGDSLPEPARSQVRESLLNLPTNWFLSASNTSGSPMNDGSTATSSDDSTNTNINTSIRTPNGLSIEDINQKINHARSSSATSGGTDSNLTANGKVLILAKESLDMVQNVMDVVDSTLGKAEEWVKQKQEVKEMFLKSLLEKQRLKESSDVPLSQSRKESSKENQ